MGNDFAWKSRAAELPVRTSDLEEEKTHLLANCKASLETLAALTERVGEVEAKSAALCQRLDSALAEVKQQLAMQEGVSALQALAERVSKVEVSCANVQRPDLADSAPKNAIFTDSGNTPATATNSAKSCVRTEHPSPPPPASRRGGPDAIRLHIAQAERSLVARRAILETMATTPGAEENGDLLTSARLVAEAESTLDELRDELTEAATAERKIEDLVSFAGKADCDITEMTRAIGDLDAGIARLEADKKGSNRYPHDGT